MVRQILATNVIGVTDLKKDPMVVVKEGGGEPVAVLNKNKPVFYCIPAETYEQIMDNLGDAELLNTVLSRQDDAEVAMSQTVGGRV